MTDSALLQAMATRPLVMDAAMGTRLIERGLNLRDDDPALWNETHPEVVSAIHARDAAAGAEALVANTFGANRTWLARFGRGDDARGLNRAAIVLARAGAGPDRFVLGALGPTADDDALREQVEALHDSGVDGLLFETHTIERATHSLSLISADVPILVSLLSWPEPPGEAARILEDLGAAVLGANCQDGPAATLAILQTLAGATRLPLLAKPAAGLPGGPRASPEDFAAVVPALRDLGVKLIGGCCGTSDAHVAAIRVACYDPANALKRPLTDLSETRSA